MLGRVLYILLGPLVSLKMKHGLAGAVASCIAHIVAMTIVALLLWHVSQSETGRYGFGFIVLSGLLFRVVCSAYWTGRFSWRVMRIRQRGLPRTA